MKPERPRVLLIIAPSLFECYHAARAHGLEPGRIQNFRNITKAADLRGIRTGTAFITANRSSWPATQAGFDLDRMLETLQRTGTVRIAQSDDLDACRMPDTPLADRPRIGEARI